MKTIRLANPLLTFNNAKTIKGQPLGYRTAILYLAPHKASGVINTCEHSSKECRATCLYKSGNAILYPKVNQARVRKTKLLHAQPDLFWEVIHNEIDSLRSYCLKHYLKPAVRLNGTSDIYNASIEYLMWMNQDVDFYDYTKDFGRIKDFIQRRLPHNYSLTFSHSEANFAQSISCLESGVNVAVVFDVGRGKKLPATWCGYKVVDGDVHDLRFLDTIDSIKNQKAVVIGLRAKGSARKLKPRKLGFVQPNTDT